MVLYVHAGIAASDVISCASLGEHAKGENHHEAITLLMKVDRDAARHLGTPLKMKTKTSYSHAPTTADESRKQAGQLTRSLSGLGGPTRPPAASGSGQAADYRVGE